MRRYGIKKLDTKHKLLPWIIRHSAFLPNAFQKRRKTGFTPHRERTGRDYEEKVYEFAETILWRENGDNRAKLSSPWQRGIWLGKDMKSTIPAVE